MDLYKLFSNTWEPLTQMFLNYFNWYIVTFIYAFFFYLVSLLVWKMVSNEFVKRKEIMKDIDLYKGTHPNEIYPKLSKEHMKSIFHRNQQNYPESYYKALEEIVKRRKGNPLLAMFFVFIQYILLATTMGYLSSVDSELPEIKYLMYLPIMLIGIQMFNKKLVVIKVIFLSFLIYVFHFIGPVALLFISYLTGFRFLQFCYNKIKVRFIQKKA